MNKIAIVTLSVILAIVTLSVILAIGGLVSCRVDYEIESGEFIPDYQSPESPPPDYQPPQTTLPTQYYRLPKFNYLAFNGDKSEEKE